jgi:hypothetical protein
MRSAKRERANPAAAFLCNDDVRRLRADVKINHRPGLLAQVVVICHRVVHRQRAQRDGFGRQAKIAIQRQLLLNTLLRNREDADFDLRRIVAGERLVVPLDLVDGKGNLLHRLKLDDVGHLLRLDRRQLGEARKCRCPGTLITRCSFSNSCCEMNWPERQPHHLVLIKVRRGQHLPVGYDSKVGDVHVAAITHQPHCLDGVGSDFNAPGRFVTWHGVQLQLKKSSRPGIALKLMIFSRLCISGVHSATASHADALCTAAIRRREYRTEYQSYTSYPHSADWRFAQIGRIIGFPHE